MAITTFQFGSAGRSIRIDEAGDFTFVGRAQPGASESDTVWQISRLDKSVAGDLKVLWADGNQNFDNVWANRATLSYS